MAQKSGIFTGHLIKRSGKLVYESPTDVKKYDDFIKKFDEEQHITVFFEANKDDATLAQIAKAKVCIREIASYTGDSFDTVERRVKRKSGLSIRLEEDGEVFLITKSFANCSKEELGLAIETIIEMGNFFNMDLR